jgi:hypothetical protein
MLHVGLDLRRKRVDVHVMNDAGDSVDTWAVLPDRGGPRALVRRLEKRSRCVNCTLGARWSSPMTTAKAERPSTTSGGEIAAAEHAGEARPYQATLLL